MPITLSDFQFFRFTFLGCGILVAPASAWTAVILQKPWQVYVRVYTLGKSQRSPIPSQLRKCFRQAHNGSSVANRKSKRPRKIRSQEGPRLQRAIVAEFHRPLRVSFCLCKCWFPKCGGTLCDSAISFVEHASNKSGLLRSSRLRPCWSLCSAGLLRFVFKIPGLHHDISFPRKGDRE